MESIKWNVGLWDPMYDPAIEIKQEEMDNDKDKVPKMIYGANCPIEMKQGLAGSSIVVVHYYMYASVTITYFLHH